MRIKIPNISGFEFDKLSYSDFTDSLNELILIGWEKVNLGKCSDGINDVYGLSLGDTTKPTIFIEGGIHGYNEWRCCYWVRNFAKEVGSPANPALKKMMSELRARFHFFIIPCLNPWGYSNFVRWNYNEIDINRNFNAYWDEFEPEPGWGGKGETPFSEPESRMVRDKVIEFKPVLFIDCHSWGGGAGGTNNLCAPNYQKFYRAGFDAIMSMRYNINTEYIIYYVPPSERPLAAVWAASIKSQWGIEPLASVCESGFQQPVFDEAYIGMNQLLSYCAKVLDYYNSSRMVF